MVDFIYFSTKEYLVDKIQLLKQTTKNGDPRKVLFPISSNGELCGVEDESRPNLLIMDYKSIKIASSLLSIFLNRRLIINSKSICYGECPTYLGFPTIKEHVCIPEVNITDNNSLQNAIKKKQCMKYNYPTYELFKYCILDMKILQSTSMSIRDFLESLDIESLFNFLSLSPILFTQISIIDEAVAELSKIKLSLILYFFICLLISIIILGLLSYQIYSIMLTFFVLTLTISILGLILTCLIPNKINNIIETSETAYIINKKIESIINGRHDQLNYATIALFVILIIFHIFFGLIFKKSITEARMYAKKAGKASMFLVFNSIVPLITLIIQISLLYLIFYIIMCIVTAKTNNAKYFRIKSDGSIKFEEICDMTNSEPNYKCAFGGFSINVLWSFILIYVVIFTLWTMFIVQGISTYIISYSYYKYYLTDGKNRRIFYFCSSFKGIKALFSFNIGSIVIGAIMISLLKILYFILKLIMSAFGLSNYLDHQELPKFLKVAADFFKRIVGKISRKTYIEIVVAKKNIISSTKKAVKMANEDIRLTIIINIFCSIFLFVGTIIASSITTLCAFLHMMFYLKNIDHPGYLSFAVLFLSILESYSVLSVYTYGVLTLYSWNYHQKLENNNHISKNEIPN